MIRINKTKCAIMNGQEFVDKSFTHLHLRPESLHPYQKDSYRVVSCNTRYQKYSNGSKHKYITFNILLNAGAIKTVKVSYDLCKNDEFNTIRHRLNEELPVIIKFSNFIAITYKVGHSTGISLYADNFSLVKNLPENLSPDELAYFTAPYDYFTSLGKVLVYVPNLKASKHFHVVNMDENNFPIVRYKGKEYKTTYKDIERDIPVCSSVCCSSCINKHKRNDCRTFVDPKNLMIALVGDLEDDCDDDSESLIDSAK